MMNKRGQVAIFIILAVVIVVAVLLFVLIRQQIIKIPGPGEGEEFNFNRELRNCLESNEEIDKRINLILSQGGSYDPELYLLNGGKKFEYLCYTEDYYDTCVMQRPFPLQHTEEEISRVVENEVVKCFEDAKKEAEKRGYRFVSSGRKVDVEFIPNYLRFSIDATATLSKNDETIRFDGFEIEKESQGYSLIMLSNSILNYEGVYGDSDILAFMTLYPEIKVEKKKQSDGTTLYFVSSRETGEEFNFASKSLVWPHGY